jgi:hypothetical protein
VNRLVSSVLGLNTTCTLFLVISAPPQSQVLTLTHEKASGPELNPYAAALFKGMPVQGIYGRCATLEPTCNREHAVFYGWRVPHIHCELSLARSFSRCVHVVKLRSSATTLLTCPVCHISDAVVFACCLVWWLSFRVLSLEIGALQCSPEDEQRA